MKNEIESMMKDRLPVHPKCQGQEFTDEEQKALRSKICDRIEPLPIEYIIDEETQQTENTGETTVEDPSCRCTAYINPSYWWRYNRRCPLATHFRPDLVTQTAKGRVGQQKQKKHR